MIRLEARKGKETMGWTFSNGWQDKKDLVKYLTNRCKSVAHSVRGNELYIALESTTMSGEKYRIIEVCLLSKSDGMWGYKDMDEFMGPYSFNCPKKIINAVPEEMWPKATESAQSLARKWRLRCAKVAERKKLKLEAGKTYKLTESYGGKTVTLLKKLRRGWSGDVEGQIFKIQPRMIQEPA